MKGKPKKASSSGKSALNASSRTAAAGHAKAPTIRDNHGREIKDTTVEDDDTELNSGFGDYIRSPEAIEMMKLFVVANSVVIILTMAWPNMKEMYKMFEEWWFYKNL